MQAMCLKACLHIKGLVRVCRRNHVPLWKLHQLLLNRISGSKFDVLCKYNSACVI